MVVTATSRSALGSAMADPIIVLSDVIRVYREADVETIALMIHGCE